ncbi:MAG: peptidase S41, partial [Bacteroidetes bacterium]|nr:peptidase S41 [Bacteroidota bacterium]
VTANLYTGNYFFKFANKFARENSSISEIEKFEISDTLYDEFCAFLDQENFSYTTESELMIEKMREIAEEEAYKDAIETQLHALEEKLKSYKKNDLQKHRNEVEELLKMEIAQRYYYQKGKIIAALQNDPELKTAFDILEDEARYHEILSPNQ